MTKKQRTILLAILGVAGVLAIAVIGTGIWIVRSLVQNEPMNEATATRSFDDVRARFGATRPVIALRDGPVLLRRPPETQPVSDIERYGPALLVDDTMPNEDRVLIWSD